MTSSTTIDRRRVILGPSGDVLRTVSDTAPDLQPSAYIGSFQGADFTRDRGYVYIPGIDSKKEVDSWSRHELNKRSRFIYNSGGGLMHRCVDGVARMICGTGMLPHPTPVRVKGREQKIREWVHHVRMLYMQRCGSAKTYDLAQRRNVFQDQRACIRSKIVDGDSAKILARDLNGRLRRKRYESHQIGNGNSSQPSSLNSQLSGWFDGILCGPHNEMQALRLVTTDDNGKETTVDVPAQNVLFSMNDERIHQVRGLTRFYPVLNKVLDRGEILAAITKGIKIASNVAYVIEQQAVQTPQLNAGAPGTTLAPRPTKTIQTPDGKQVNLEQFLAGGEAWGLQPGQTFKIAQSQNPHANVQSYLHEMVRDVAWAIKYSPEILWNIIELGGANMRFVQADLAQQIEVEQDDLVDEDLGPDYVAWLYDMIVAGEVEEIDGWERHVWIAPARLTVDFGRDGKLYIEELKRGLRTMQSMYGMRGEIALSGIDDYLDERLHIKNGITDRGLTWEEAFPEVRQQVIGAEDPNAAATTSQADTQQQLDAMSQRLDEIHHAITFAREPKS